FTVGPEQQLTEEQFLDPALVSPSDEQRRRLAVYRQLFDRSGQPRFPSQPTMVLWASPLDLGFQYPDEFHRTGSALVTIPLRFDPPVPRPGESATRVLVPGPFVSYQSIK